MKSLAFLCLCTIFSSAAFAQKEQPKLYSDKQLDSLSEAIGTPKGDFDFQQPKVFLSKPGEKKSHRSNPASFEELNPGAVVLNETSRGTIYSMPTDNMPVLVPNRSAVNMPTRKPNIVTPRRNQMPNPLHKP